MTRNSLIYHLILFALLAMGSGIHAQASRAQVAGEYARNTAEGWRRYTQPDGTEVEIIPDVPSMEYLELKRFGKAIYRGGRDEYVWEHQGHWKISEDTLSIKYISKVQMENGKWVKSAYSIKYYFTQNCALRVLARPDASFYRIKPECLQ